MWRNLPLSECCNDNLFRLTATTAEDVIPCSGRLADRPPSLLHFPVDGSGQPLFSLESASSHTGQEAILAGQNTGSPAVNGDGILHTPVSPRLTPSSSFSPFRLSDPHSSFTSTRFDDGIFPTPHFFTSLPSPSESSRALRRSGSFRGPHALGSASTGFFYTRFSLVTLDPWGASPFLFSPPVSPASSIFSSSVSCPRVSFYSFPPPLIPACASCVTSLSSSSPSSSRTVHTLTRTLSLSYTRT